MPTITPNGRNPLSDVYQAIADLANNGGNGVPSLKEVDSTFNAYTRIPGPSDGRLPYPFMIPLPPKFYVADRTMGSGSDRPMLYTVPLLLLVGLSSNDAGPLMNQAQRYILPLISLYTKNRTLGGTVRGIIFNGPNPLQGAALQSECVMGDITLNKVTHFGFEVPMHIYQFQYIYA